MKHYCLPILAGVAIAAAASMAQAQDYPTRQITLIAPWPAGGAVDALCRAVAPHLSDRLGKSVVVENRPGAGSVIGTAAGAKAAPDGYTMVMAGSGSLAISATMYKKLPYDPIKDLVPIALGAKIPFVLVVNPSLPVRSVAELVQYAKDNPGRALGVSTAVRLPAAPDIPPIAEAGVPGFDAAGWGVFAMPAGTPKEVVGRLQAALAEVLALPDVQQQIIKLGMIPGSTSSPEELEPFIASEIARWGKVVTQAGLAGTSSA